MQNVSVSGRKKPLVKYTQGICVIHTLWILFYDKNNNRNRMKNIFKEARWSSFHWTTRSFVLFCFYFFPLAFLNTRNTINLLNGLPLPRGLIWIWSIFYIFILTQIIKILFIPLTSGGSLNSTDNIVNWLGVWILEPDNLGLISSSAT